MVYRSCMPLKKTPLSIKPLDKLIVKVVLI